MPGDGGVPTSVLTAEVRPPVTLAPSGVPGRLAVWLSSLGGRQFLLLLVVLVPVLLGQLAIYSDRLGQQREEARRENLAGARAAAASLDAFVSDVLRAEQPLGLALASGGLSPAAATRLLEHTAEANPALSDLTWLDAQGRAVVSTQPGVAGRDLSDRWFFRDLAQGREWVVGDLEQAAAPEAPVFMIARGIRGQQGQLAGVILASVDPVHLDLVLTAPARAASEGVLDRQGLLVYHYPANPDTWSQRAWLREQDPDVQAALDAAYHGGEVSITLPSLGGAANVVLAAAPVQNLGWVATYYRPEAPMLAPLQEDIARQMGLLLLIGLAATAAASLLTRWATEPLARLRRQATALGGGKYDHPLAATGPLEVRELANTLNSMAEEVRSRERRLRENEQLLAAALDQMPAGVLIVYASAPGLLVANEEAARIWRQPLPDALSAVRSPSFSASHLDGRPVVEDEWPLQRALRHGEVIGGEELEIVRGDGTPGTISISAAPIRDADGRVLAAVAVFTDISEKKRAAERLRGLVELSGCVLAETTVEGLLQRTVQAAREMIDARVATAWYGLRPGTSAVCVTTETDAGSPRAASSRFAVERGGVYLDLVYDKPTLRLTDGEMREHPSWWGLPAGHKSLRGFLGARLVGNDGWANGLIMLTDKSGGEFTAEDEAVLAQLAALVSLALQHIEARRGAERQTEQLRALLGSMSEAVTIYDASGNILLRNEAAKRLSLLPDRPRLCLADYEQLNVTTSNGEPIPFENRAVHRLLRGERNLEMEYWLGRPDGTRRRVAASGSAIYDEEGKVELAILVSRDITELRELEQTREEFVQIIAHDLRNPLTVVMGNAHWLRRHLSDDDRQREAAMAERIELSARRMAAMIQDLVDSSRLERGQLELDKAPTDLAQLVVDVAARIGSPGDQARLRVEAPERLPPALVDVERVERTIVNLVANALKYSAADRPVVIKVEARDGQAVVSVADQGVGIASEDLSRIFQRYYRATPVRRREGLGLGLYIARLLVEAHGGRIWVESQPGVGSTFSFALPLAGDS